eukprot:Nk52_evm1s733 gene=Nk52_evmTU1s733
MKKHSKEILNEANNEANNSTNTSNPTTPTSTGNVDPITPKLNLAATLLNNQGESIEQLIKSYEQMEKDGSTYDTPVILEKPRKLNTDLTTLTGKNSGEIDPWFRRTRLVFLKSGTEEEMKVLPL